MTEGMASGSRPLALVTGASSGIGLELAKQFAETGFDLVVNAEDAGLAPAAQELRATGATVQEVQADLRTATGVDTLWATVTTTGRQETACSAGAVAAALLPCRAGCQSTGWAARRPDLEGWAGPVLGRSRARTSLRTSPIVRSPARSAEASAASS